MNKIDVFNEELDLEDIEVEEQSPEEIEVKEVYVKETKTVTIEKTIKEKGLKGEDGVDGTNGTNGLNGKDWKCPTKKELKALIKEVFPEDKLLEKLIKKMPKEEVESIEIGEDRGGKYIKKGGKKMYLTSGIWPVMSTWVHDFLHLTDAPHTYVGQAGKVVKVKSDETGLEFGEGGGGSSISVNGVEVTDPNFIDSESAEFLVNGSDVSLTIPDTADYSVFLRYSASDQVTAASFTSLTWDTEVYDTDSMYSGANPTRITFNHGGKYLIWGGMSVLGGSTSPLSLRIYLNWTTAIAQSDDPAWTASTSFFSTAQMSFPYEFSYGDYIELQQMNVEENTINGTDTNLLTYFSAHIIDGGNWTGAVDALVAWTGISIDATDPAHPIVSSTITQYTDEMAQDAVGNAVGAGLSYDDTSWAISSTITQYTDEMAQDAVGNSVWAGLSYNDTTGAISSTTPTTFARVTGSNVTRTAQTLWDITGLSIALEANSVYEICVTLMIWTSAVTTGTRYWINFTGSGSPTISAGYLGTTTDGSNTNNRMKAFNTATTGAYMTTSGSTNGSFFLSWTVTTDSWAGDLTVQHLKVTSGTSTVFIGSYMKVTKIS